MPLEPAVDYFPDKPARPTVTAAKRKRAKRKVAPKGAPKAAAPPEPAVAPEELGPLLDEIEATLDRYISVSDHQRTVAVLWPAHAHAIEAFDYTPRLFLRSVTPGSGKTKLLNTAMWLARKGQRFGNASSAMIFRAIDGSQPAPVTIGIDEADGQLTIDQMDKVHLLNEGFEYGGSLGRCVGDTHEPRRFNVFGPVAIAGLKNIPQDALRDRCITIDMVPCGTKKRFKIRELEPVFLALGKRLAATIASLLDELRDLEVELPEGLDPRQRDKWRPLLQVAALAGGAWPGRVREACLALSGEEEVNAAVAFVTALHRAFGDDATVRSTELVERLKAEGGVKTSVQGLPKRLKALRSKVHPRQDERGSFYRRADCAHLFKSFLPPGR